MSTTTTQLITASSLPDIITTVNTYLATLTNPIIHKIDLQMQDQPHRIGTEYRVLIVTEDGGAVVATPWQLNGVAPNTAPLFGTSLQALYTANQAYFWGGPCLAILDDGLSGKMPLYTAVLLYNVTNNANVIANYDIR